MKHIKLFTLAILGLSGAQATFSVSQITKLTRLPQYANHARRYTQQKPAERTLSSADQIKRAENILKITNQAPFYCKDKACPNKGSVVTRLKDGSGILLGTTLICVMPVVSFLLDMPLGITYCYKDLKADFKKPIWSNSQWGKESELLKANQALDELKKNNPIK